MYLLPCVLGYYQILAVNPTSRSLPISRNYPNSYSLYLRSRWSGTYGQVMHPNHPIRQKRPGSVCAWRNKYSPTGQLPSF
ncbi:MAG: hypothetical protein UY22_C0020G0016 [Candidatus Amesbacteria bacterium GW2011_GWC1_48_10]|uniref:Uncharacterized protein n=1 Tax=Candidatus Amesbacteria bacterium GW2011_GWC1_48_10 TaxID=1618365 RepID=A0A0G1XG14_9BACT|nr:MAG: hypothetical protein UY22_C0020G0016 [Candidatus Amesbacteria bacterium GW2011_GWC1_48_10]